MSRSSFLLVFSLLAVSANLDPSSIVVTSMEPNPLGTTNADASPISSDQASAILSDPDPHGAIEGNGTVPVKSSPEPTNGTTIGPSDSGPNHATDDTPEIDEEVFTKVKVNPLGQSGNSPEKEAISEIIAICINDSGATSYFGNECLSEEFVDRGRPAHSEIVQVKYGPMREMALRLMECDTAAVVMKRQKISFSRSPGKRILKTPRDSHYLLEYYTNAKNLQLPLNVVQMGRTTFTVQNEKLSCSPNCTLTARNRSNADSTLYSFKTEFFLWENKERADLVWCLKQKESNCYIGRECTQGLPGPHGTIRFITAKLRNTILSDKQLNATSAHCDVGAIVSPTDEPDRFLFDYHTNEDNLDKPIFATIRNSKRLIVIDENDNLKCDKCNLTTHYFKTFVDNNNKTSFFWTGEIRADFVLTPDGIDKEGNKGGSSANGAALGGGAKEEGKKEEEASTVSTIIIIALSSLFVFVILALVAGTTYQRYQKAKNKRKLEAIQATVNPGASARASRREAAPLLPAVSSSDPSSEKSAKDSKDAAFE